MVNKPVLNAPKLLSDFTPVSHEALDNGIPTKRFRKDLIEVGVYKHPEHGWLLDTTTERMDRWIAAFKRMTEAGIRVPVPSGHSYDPRDGQGFMVEVERVGDKLFGVLEFIGEEAISLAYRTKQVSISINPKFVDGKGTDYGEVIEHVALTGYPVVPGQGDFQALAASLYVLSTDTGKGEDEMTKEQIEKLRKMLGAGEDLTAENAFERIEQRFEEGSKAKTDLDKKVSDLSAQVESLTAKLAASTKDDKKVDPEILDERAESAEDKIDALVEKGKILPAVAASLKEALVGKAGTRNAFCLSRTISGTTDSVLNSVVKALDQNDPVKLGEQTKRQAIGLSRQVPGGSEDVTKADPEVIRMATGQ